MGDHIVRRDVASGPRQSDPRPTAEISKQQLQGLIRDHARAPQPAGVERRSRENQDDRGRREALEAELGGEAPETLPASSQRLLSHTLRRPDVSTIAMPRLARDAAAAIDDPPTAAFDDGADPAAFEDEADPAAFEDEADPAAFDEPEPPVLASEPVPPAVETFEGDASKSIREALPITAQVPTPPHIDRSLGPAVLAERRAPPPMWPRAPAGRLLRVLPITLSMLVAAGAAYLLFHSGL